MVVSFNIKTSLNVMGKYLIFENIVSYSYIILNDMIYFSIRETLLKMMNLIIFVAFIIGISMKS